MPLEAAIEHGIDSKQHVGVLIVGNEGRKGVGSREEAGIEQCYHLIGIDHRGSFLAHERTKEVGIGHTTVDEQSSQVIGSHHEGGINLECLTQHLLAPG